MTNRLHSIMMGGAILASVFGASLSGAMAASAAGTGPADALVPTGQWTTAAPAQQTWYEFQYGGDSSQITVRMAVDSSNSASFEVWTADQIQQWVRGDTVTPVGRGSANDYFGGDLVWAGSFNEPGAYYVVVSDTSMSPASYDIQVMGDAVSMPKVVAPTQAATQAVTPATMTASDAVPEAAPQGGSGPVDALPITGKWAPLAVGQQVWYAFPYSGDGSEVTVRMSVDPGNGASFAVWTQQEAMQSALDSAVQPVGRGSVDDSLGGDQVWANSSNTGGAYYVVVTQTGSAPANYQLSIN